MAVDTKKYLDLVGLTHYDEKIKAYIKTNGSDVTDKLVALIGAAEKGADEATILARITDLETAIGDVSELGVDIANLTKAILGESARAQTAEKTNSKAINTLDEKLYGSDFESEGENVHTKGDIEKIQDRLNTLEEDINDVDTLENRVGTLEATHAKKTVGEGDTAKEVFKTVAEEVNEAVTDLIDGAPAALDTLKEIADWIANQNESGVTDAATLVARVESNAQAISNETERAEGAESDLQDAIDAIEEKVDSFERIAETEIDKLFDEITEEEIGENT